MDFIFLFHFYKKNLFLEYPKQGRCAVEIIKELDKMVIDLLQVFARTCGNSLPNRIIFYRDGVDDGKFQKVLDNEVNKVKEACRSKSSFYLKNLLSYSYV